jgi:hypothetical protein
MTRKATYEQLVSAVARSANLPSDNNCSYAIAAKLYKVAKGDVLAFVEFIGEKKSRPQSGQPAQQGQQCPDN